MTETFGCEFPDNRRCVIRVKKPAPNENHRFQEEWTGTPTVEIFNQYKEWVHTINQELAVKWGRSIKHIFVFSQDKAEAWEYEPNQPPRPSTI